MNIRKRKQKGSSLLLVIMIFSVLTILGVSILSLTASAFKSRVVESAERRNRYFAESGIDLAYGMIGKLVDKGIEDGNQAAEDFMQQLKDDDVLEKEREIVKNGGTSNYINQDGTVNEDYIKQMQNQKFQESYKSSVISAINNKWYKNEKYIIPITNDNYNSNNIAENLNVTINEKKGDIVFKEIQYQGKTKTALSLNLSSAFTENSMIKTIAVNYKILLPDYKDVYYIETNKFTLPINSVWNKAFCIDGNLNIGSNFEVKGDIYIKGKDGDDSGINITGSGGTATFGGNVSSFGGLQVSNSNNVVTFKNNLYSGNVLIKDSANNIDFTVDGAVYTNNDLAINGIKNDIDIKNGFYGINDVNKAEGIDENEKPKVSSCLLVNSDDIGSGTSITIGNEAIFMGTAYIKETTPSYQTGESVSVKGNYRAYSNPLNSDIAKYEYETDEFGNMKKDSNGNPILKKDKDGNLILRENGGYTESNVKSQYIDLLKLVTQFKNGNNLSWQDKSNYFHIYAQEYKDKSGLSLGNGISLPNNIIHIGAIVDNGDTSPGNFISDSDGKVKDKQTKYATKIYAMDDPEGIDVDSAFAQNAVKRKIFSLGSDGKVDKTISQVDFTKLGIDQLNTTTYGDIIYLNNSSKDCVLVGANSAIDETKYSSARKIYLQGGSRNGIILTRGNVYLAGEVNFKGTIISTGDIETIDSTKKTLNYDSNYVERLIAYNYKDYFQDVFIRNSSTCSQNVEVDSNVSKDNNAGTDILRDKLIIMEKWKIIK